MLVAPLLFFFRVDLAERVLAGDEAKGTAAPPGRMDRSDIVNMDYFPDVACLEAFAFHVGCELDHCAGGILFAQVAGQEELCESNGYYLHTYICRTGTIAEHIDLDAVFDFYCKLGIYAPRDEVRRLCDVEIRQYGTPNAPFVYFTPYSEAQLIASGLLLGYPLESTVSIVCGY